MTDIYVSKMAIFCEHNEAIEQRTFKRIVCSPFSEQEKVSKEDAVSVCETTF